VASAVAFIIVLWNTIGIIRKSKEWVATEGILIGYEVRIHRDSNNDFLSNQEQEMYHGQYEYEDQKGNKYIHVSEIGHEGRYRDLGTVRRVYFNNNRSSESRGSYESGNELNYLGVVFGGIFLITAIYLYASIAN